MNEQGPASLAHESKFSTSLLFDSPDAAGCFSDDGAYSYLYDGPILKVFGSSGQAACQYDFSSQTLSDNINSPIRPSILCVCTFNKVNLLVGLEYPDGDGQICLFNMVLCKILRVFSLPCGVTAVECIYAQSDPTELDYLSDKLKSFSGIIACGTKQGQLYIIDLLLDQTVDSSEPLKLFSLDASKEVSAAERAEHLASQEALCYSLACADSTEHFSYQAANGKVIFLAAFEEVFVSSLKFVPQLATLFVGYNFGSYQLWRTDQLLLDFSSPVVTGSLPVSHFAYQEPENDPRSYCYVWVCRCSDMSSTALLSTSMEEYVNGTTANFSIYQLVYESKTFTDSGSVLFKDLLQSGCVLEHLLAPEDCDVLTSWVVSCETLSNVKSMKSLEEDSRIEGAPTDTNLVLISWRVRYIDNSVTSHFAIFDINRWYHAYMPSTIRWSEGWCSYFSQYSFDEVVKNESCLDVKIQTQTITCYKAPNLIKQECFLYPASLSFEALFLMPNGTASAPYYGLQRHSLMNVLSCGHTALIKPTEYYDMLVTSGVLESHREIQKAPGQQKALLTCVLLHNHLEYVIDCINMWNKEDYSKVGCTVGFIYEWIRERLECIIQDLDFICIPLFDGSGLPIESEFKQLMLTQISQMHSVIIILKHLQSLSLLGNYDIEEDLLVANSRLLHMKLVWWCVCRGILPEVKEGCSLPSCLSYPLSTLRRSYNNLQSNLLTHTSSKDNSELMVDKIFLALGPELLSLFRQEGGTERYPPPNVRALLNIFLLEQTLDKKLFAFIYTLVDLMAYMDQSMHYSLSNHLTGILSTLVPGEDYSRIVLSVLSLWYLDHREYQDLLLTLKQPGACLHLPAQYCESIILTLLSHNQSKVALELLGIITVAHKVPDSITISVYLANNLISSAIDCARQSSTYKETIMRIIKAVKTNRQMSDLLCLPLTQADFSCVYEHLGEKGELDKLVIHFLQTGNLAEAIKLNRKLNSQPLWRGDQKAKERAMTRDKLVQWQLSLLPPIQKKLLEDPTFLSSTRPKTNRPKVFRPDQNFFFVNREPKPLAPLEIVKVMMEVNPISPDFKPFVQPLTPSAVKSRQALAGAISVLSEKRKNKSVTGLFDYPRSPSKRSMTPPDDCPLIKTKRHSLLSSGVKALLRTPQIKRKSPSAMQSVNLVTATPHSILKMRKPLINSSPSMLSPSIRFNFPPPDTAKQTKSTGRVKFKEQEFAEETSVCPKVISFEDEELEGKSSDPLPGTLDISSNDASMAESPNKPDSPDSDDDEIQLNFSAPLLPVLTAASHIQTEQDNSDEESFASVSSEFTSPQPKTLDKTVSQQSMEISSGNESLVQAMDTYQPLPAHQVMKNTITQKCSVSAMNICGSPLDSLEDSVFSKPKVSFGSSVEVKQFKPSFDVEELNGTTFETINMVQTTPPCIPDADESDGTFMSPHAQPSPPTCEPLPSSPPCVSSEGKQSLPKSSPKSSPKASPKYTGLKSLSALDEEAKLSGLELRQVREAVMNREHEFLLSPVQIVAESDSKIDARESALFDFSAPSNAVKNQKVRSQKPEVAPSLEKSSRKPLFYFSPVQSIQCPDVPVRTSSSHEFAFTPPTPVNTEETKKRRKPIRPAVVALPLDEPSKNVEDGRSTRSRGSMAPYTFVKPAEHEDTERPAITDVNVEAPASTSQAKRNYKPVKVDLPPENYDTKRQTRSRNVKASSKEVEAMEIPDAKPSSPARRGRARMQANVPIPEGDNNEVAVTPTRRGRTKKKDDVPNLEEAVQEIPVTPTRRGRTKMQVDVPNHEEPTTEVPVDVPSHEEPTTEVPVDVPNHVEPKIEVPVTPTRRGRTKKHDDIPNRKDAVQEIPATPTRKGRSKTQVDVPNPEEPNEEVQFTPTRRGRTKKQDDVANPDESVVQIRRSSRKPSVQSATDMVTNETTTKSRKAQSQTASVPPEPDKRVNLKDNESEPAPSGWKGRSRRGSASSVASGTTEDTKPSRSRKMSVSSDVSEKADNEGASEPQTPTRRGRQRKPSSQLEDNSPGKGRNQRSSSQPTEILPPGNLNQPVTASRVSRRAQSEEPRGLVVINAAGTSSAIHVDVKVEGTRAKQSPTEVSMTSPKRSQTARKANNRRPSSVSKARTTVKKTPDLSPILSPGDNTSSKNIPRTRARRKL